jgi:hypothetical protein
MTAQLPRAGEWVVRELLRRIDARERDRIASERAT